MSKLTKKSLTIVMAAGGTGGHMIPAEAVAVELKKRGHTVTLVTDPRGDAYPGIMDGFDRHVLNTSGLGAGLFGKAKGAISLMKETLACRKYLTSFSADMVVGFGGYPSMPALSAAKFSKIPFMLHEQNTVLGRVNRLMATSAAALALSYEDTQRLPSGVEFFVTGNPVRSQVIDVLGKQFKPPRSNGKVSVLIMGGSQGARILSQAVPKGLASLPEELRGRLSIVHQARPEDKQAVVDIYGEAGIQAEVDSYFLDIPKRLSTSHLVISRAGASSLAEISAIGIPSILVPLKIAMDDHQTTNAAALSDAGGAKVINEADFTDDAISTLLTEILSDGEAMTQMAQAAKSTGHPESAQTVADTIEKVCKRS